jgi:hypothetical protein
MDGPCPEGVAHDWRYSPPVGGQPARYVCGRCGRTAGFGPPNNLATVKDRDARGQVITALVPMDNAVRARDPNLAYLARLRPLFLAQEWSSGLDLRTLHLARP